jgi:hypothetical protein
MSGWRARAADSVMLAIGWRYATHAVMVALALVNETRPAPTLPDAVLSVVPRVDWIARHNYHVWLLAYVPIAAWLWACDRRAVIHFLWVGGALSLLRGVCVLLTGLGPVVGPDLNAGAGAAALWQAWLAIVNPVSALTTDAPHVALTKDLFFSGHVASTFLLWLYCRGRPRLGPAALAAHLVVTASVFLAHLHYSIDVVGAWAISYAAFALSVRRWPLERPVRAAGAGIR